MEKQNSRKSLTIAGIGLAACMIAGVGLYRSYSSRRHLRDLYEGFYPEQAKTDDRITFDSYRHTLGKSKAGGVHIFKFASVDTTMRLADEFPGTLLNKYLCSGTVASANSPLDSDSDDTKSIDQHSEKEEQHILRASAVAFQALEQTQGRGQHSNKWLSPQGSNRTANCATTIVLRTSCMPACAPLVSALAVSETIVAFSKRFQSFDVSPKVKWINDININDSKIGGVLVTCANAQTSSGDDCYQLSIGIGVNLNSAPIPASTCLKDVLGISHANVDDFVNMLVEKVVEKFAELDQYGFVSQSKRPSLKTQIDDILDYKGKRVNILDSGLQNVLDEGVFLGINEWGHAIIRDGQSLVKPVMHGRMRAAQ